MLISENNTERTFKLVPPGSHMAICYGFVDLGTQDYFYQGEPKKARMCRIMWELHGEDADGNPLTLDDGRPLSISAKYTISLHENAKLRIMLKSWRNKDFTEAERRGYDIRTILGQHCMITVEHRTKDDKTFANVGAVTGVPAALRKLGLPDQVNKRTYFSFGYYDQSEFDSLTDGLKKIIMQSPEWEARSKIKHVAPTKLDDIDDDIPF